LVQGKYKLEKTMRSARTIGTIVSATASVLCLASRSIAGPATQPGDGQANVPVKEVVLFSSGVGYFEHFGQVKDDSATVLHFKTDQINDILKSLVLEDMDGGKVAAVTYPSQGPIERTLRSFQLDLTSNPSLADLLNQLRGAQVSITPIEGGHAVDGTVLGVEKQSRPTGDKDHPQMTDVWVLNLVTVAGIQPIDLPHIGGVWIADPELRKELAAALATLAQSRDKDKKPVEIHFDGHGERRVRVGYVVETPVWKTSYRLILGGEGDPATQPARDLSDRGRGPANAAGHGQAALQGWAIVENQTDSDWKDVQLSLVSGRPISFIENLYTPLYIPRPLVQPELYASLQPQTYEGAMAGNKAADKMAIVDQDGVAPVLSDAAPRQLARQQMQRAAGFGLQQKLQSNGEEQTRKALDATASVASIASAAKVGELFQYTVGSVTISRQQSAMLPIVTDPVQVEKLSIYNQGVLPKNPLLGARVKNTTGKYLLQGPITVLESGSYAGDASIGDLPPGQERLISYGIDQNVTVQASDNTQKSSLLTGKIVKGVLELIYKQVFSQDYTAEDKAETPKTLLIEAPRHQDWKLVEPQKPLETTDSLYRFEGKLKPHQASKFTVQEERVDLQKIELLSLDSPAIAIYARTGEIPKDVRDALIKLADLKGKLTDTLRQHQEKQQQINQISQEQTRIRENMKAVSPTSDYYKRLLQELDDQETQIQDMHKQVRTFEAQEEQQRKSLEDYLGSLTVG
jgi:hypothetical protein